MPDTPDTIITRLEEEFTPSERLGGDLANLALGWQELGIDADDFLKCGRCRRFMRDCVSAEDETTEDGAFLPGIPDTDCCRCES